MFQGIIKAVMRFLWHGKDVERCSSKPRCLVCWLNVTCNQHPKLFAVFVVLTALPFALLAWLYPTKMLGLLGMGALVLLGWFAFCRVLLWS